jgi:GT2 family glycosyltransferase
LFSFEKIQNLIASIKVARRDSNKEITYLTDGSLGSHLKSNSTFNISPDGANVGIAILDYGRLQDTLRLLESVPKDFKGKIYIFSQGNQLDHISQLEDYLEGLKHIALILNPINLGVAKGRNALFKAIDCPWILSLDNDFTFESNPFPSLAQVQILSGAHFINVSFFDEASLRTCYGGHIEVRKDSNNEPRMIIRGASNAERKLLGSYYINDLIFGGASVLNRDSFISIGGFDPNFQVGFEDVDFSIRVFRSGYKVATLNKVFFNHGSIEVNNRGYREVRFNKRDIHASASLLNRKYQFNTWDQEDDEWLENRLGKN